MASAQLHVFVRRRFFLHFTSFTALCLLLMASGCRNRENESASQAKGAFGVSEAHRFKGKPEKLVAAYISLPAVHGTEKREAFVRGMSLAQIAELQDYISQFPHSPEAQKKENKGLVGYALEMLFVADDQATSVPESVVPTAALAFAASSAGKSFAAYEGFLDASSSCGRPDDLRALHAATTRLGNSVYKGTRPVAHKPLHPDTVRMIYSQVHQMFQKGSSKAVHCLALEMFLPMINGTGVVSSFVKGAPFSSSEASGPEVQMSLFLLFVYSRLAVLLDAESAWASAPESPSQLHIERINPALRALSESIESLIPTLFQANGPRINFWKSPWKDSTRGGFDWKALQSLTQELMLDNTQTRAAPSRKAKSALQRLNLETWPDGSPEAVRSFYEQLATTLSKQTKPTSQVWDALGAYSLGL